MHERNWERVAGYAGIAAVLAFVVPGFVGTGSPPKPSDPDTVFKSYLLAHHPAVMREVWLQAFGAVLLIWLASGIRSAIRHRDESGGPLGNLVFGTFVLAAGLLCMAAALTGGLAYRALPDTSPATVRLISDMSSFLTANTLALTTVIAAAVIAVAALTAHAMSRAVGYLSVAAAGVNLATSLTIFTTRGFFSLEGAFGLVQLGVTMVWLLAISIDLMRPTEATVPAMAPMVSAT